MKKLGMAVVMMVTFFVVSGCQTQQKKLSDMDSPALSNQQLMALYSKGVKLSWSSVRGSKGTTVYHPDGTGVLEWGKGDHQGQWRIVENTVCSRWEGVRSGYEKCFSNIETSPGKYNYYNDNGDLEGSLIILTH